MAERPKERRLHVGEGAQADELVDLFHDLRGIVCVPAFLKTLGSIQSSHVTALNAMVDFVN